MRLMEQGKPKTGKSKTRHVFNVAEKKLFEERAKGYPGLFTSLCLQPCLEDKVQLNSSNFVQYRLIW